LASYATALKASTLEASSAIAAEPSSEFREGSKCGRVGGLGWGANNPEGLRGGPTSGPTAGARIPLGSTLMDNDDDESWNLGSNLSDGEGKMAALTGFGGIFAEMYE
jgi:hypothetical protein